MFDFALCLYTYYIQRANRCPLWIRFFDLQPSTVFSSFPFLFLFFSFFSFHTHTPHTHTQCTHTQRRGIAFASLRLRALSSGHRRVLRFFLARRSAYSATYWRRVAFHSLRRRCFQLGAATRLLPCRSFHMCGGPSVGTCTAACLSSRRFCTLLWSLHAFGVAC